LTPTLLRSEHCTAHAALTRALIGRIVVVIIMVYICENTKANIILTRRSIAATRAGKEEMDSGSIHVGLMHKVCCEEKGLKENKYKEVGKIAAEDGVGIRSPALEGLSKRTRPIPGKASRRHSRNPSTTPPAEEMKHRGICI